jgi:hypothetical protein
MIKSNNWLKYMLISCLFIVISCNGNKSKTISVEEEMAAAGLTKESDITFDTKDIASMHAGAKSILEFRYKEQGVDPVASIEMDRWYYQFIATGSRIEPVQDGRWIDFYPDLTYEYGDENGVKGKGKYHYSISSSILLIVDNDPTVKPQEYDAKLNGPVMVLVGKPTYKDNHMQMKLQQDYPKEPVSAQ